MYMSYDKYIKYKSKYLQLKAKYTQVGGGLLWVITNLSQHGKATESITQIESDAINKRIPYSSDKSVEIKSGTLTDDKGKKINDYGYTINSEGNKGTRNSLRGKYDMMLQYIPDSHASASSTPASSAPPAQPPRYSSAPSHASYTPPTPHPRSAYVPPAQPPHSASSVPFLYEIPDLPDYFTIYDKFDSDGQRYKIVCVKKFELMQHLTNIGDSITIDGIVYTKNTGSTIQMKTKNNYIYQLNNTDDGDTFCIYNK